MKKTPKKILVIDDDTILVRILDKSLRADGYEVIGALKGGTGIERAKNEHPDLIVLDLMLPDIGGTEVTRRLKGDPQTKDIPILFITVTMGVENDKGDEHIEIDGKKYRIFAKPLHNRKLLSTIRKLINMRAHKNI